MTIDLAVCYVDDGDGYAWTALTMPTPSNCAWLSSTPEIGAPVGARQRKNLIAGRYNLILRLPLYDRALVRMSRPIAKGTSALANECFPTPGHFIAVGSNIIVL